MSGAHADPVLPRPLLIGAGALMALAVLLAGFARYEASRQAVEQARAVFERALRFEDRADGGIDVIDARLAERVAVIEPGSNGFLRGALRGLARERKRMGLGPEVPFRLLSGTDGRLLLEDPATRRRVDLGSFGPTNRASFARLLEAGAPRT